MLVEVVSAIGTDSFYKVVFDRLREEIAACQLVIHRFNLDLGANWIQPLAFEADDGISVRNCVNQYLAKLHSRDPLRPALVPSADRRVSVKTLSTDQIADNEYRERLFADSKLAGKMSLIIRQPGHVLSVSVYRHVSRGFFRADDIVRFSSIGPILSAALDRHSALRQQASGTVQDLTHVFASLAVTKPLSEREAAICAYILLGHSNLAISLNLKLSIHTVSTYRRRAYSKLNITSQSELFALILRQVGGDLSRLSLRRTESESLIIPAALNSDSRGIDRDRGTPRGAAPPTPPGIRVTTAVRPGCRREVGRN